MSAAPKAPDYQLVNDLLASLPQIYESHPEHVTLLSEMVGERLDDGPAGVEAKDRYQEILSDVVRDPRAENAIEDLQAACEKLPTVETARAKAESEDEKLVAVGIGLAIGTVVAGAIVIHELWTSA